MNTTRENTVLTGVGVGVGAVHRPVVPTVRVVTCVVVSCGTCGGAPRDEDDFIPHFASLAEAREATVGDPDPGLRWRWTQLPDGWAATCPDCVGQQTCVEQGHRWGPWRDCRCGGLIPDHGTGCRPLRVCGRCGRPDVGPGRLRWPDKEQP